jgi:hypothetical protein
VLSLEAFAQRVRDFLFVLNDQDAHGLIAFESCSLIGIIEAVPPCRSGPDRNFRKSSVVSR